MNRTVYPFIEKTLAACLSLAVCLSAGFLTLGQDTAQAQPLSSVTSMDYVVSVPGGTKQTTISSADVNVREVLRALSRQAGFNLVLDDSVTGIISLQLEDVPINHALQTIATISGIHLMPRGNNIYMAVSKTVAEEKGITRQFSKVIRVEHSNALRVAAILNSSLFSIPGQTGNAQNLFQGRIKADPRTNSIIVLGTKRDIEVAEEAIAKLDKGRETKTFFLSHANALNIAAILSSSIFNDGINPFMLGQGGAGGGGGAGGAGGAGGGAGGAQDPLMQAFMPSQIRVTQEEVEEGSGINNFGNQSGGGGGGSGGSSGAPGPLSQNLSLRNIVKSDTQATLSPLGPLVIPDTRNNSVTVLGTKEQIQLAEQFIPILDAQVPQVAIEAALVEISDEGVKDLGTRLGIADGRLQFGFNNTGLAGNAINADTNSQTIGIPTVDPTDTNAFGRTGIGISTNPVTSRPDFSTELRALITSNKAKILSNPTIVAAHDTESIISIVDEIVRRVTVQLDAQTGTVQIQNELGEVGVVLDILPKIGEDNTINLRVRPSVSTVERVTQDAQGNVITLLSKRDILTQTVRLNDGQTLVIGGLVNESESNRQDKLPGLGDLPIVGAFFRATQRTSARSEVVIMITPHIINHTNVTPVHATVPVGL